jgi:hypothetical protein
MSALCLFNQTCKLLLEMRAFNLTALIAFIFEASNKINDANALARTGYIKCTFKGCLIMRIHAAKHNRAIAPWRALVKRAKFQTETLPADGMVTRG